MKENRRGNLAALLNARSTAAAMNARSTAAGLIRNSVRSLAAAILAALALSSCATTQGTTLATVVAVETGQKEPENPPTTPPETPPESKKGLEVISEPDKAEVWIDGDFLGLTPVVAENLPMGWHRIRLRKTGYYEMAAWVDFKSEYMLYQVTLVLITGFLQVSVFPQDSIVTIGDMRVSPGIVEIPAGSYAVLARKFGYADYKDRIVILGKSVTSLSITLNPTPFDISELSASRKAVNPDNPGVLALLDIGFSVTGPGTGQVTVSDSSSTVVFSETMPDFTTWDQRFTWNLHDSEGRSLPDGDYLVTVTGLGSGAGATEPKERAEYRASEERRPGAVTRQINVRIDRNLKVSIRALWSGSAGLIYAPTSEALPAGDFQVTVLSAAHVDSQVVRAPVELGARLGLGAGLELDLMGGAVLTAGSAPLNASVALRLGMSSPRDSLGIGSALETKISLQYDPGTGILQSDTLANFTGISVGVPIQLSLGPVSLLASIGAIASLWHPYGTLDPSPVAWLYLRGGAMLDLGELMAGVSASARTEVLPGGIFVLGSPLQVGAEAHWLIPGTNFVISGILAGEFTDVQNYYLMGGGGLGFLY